jgi:hypothetical protein
MTRGFLLARGGWGVFGSENVEKESVEISESSGGSGLPRNFAIATRTYRIRVYIPNIEPSVSLKFPNCSATSQSCQGIEYQRRPLLEISKIDRDTNTKERRMSSHKCRFKHLCESTKSTHNTLNNLKRR